MGPVHGRITRSDHPARSRAGDSTYLLPPGAGLLSPLLSEGPLTVSRLLSLGWVPLDWRDPSWVGAIGSSNGLRGDAGRRCPRILQVGIPTCFKILRPDDRLEESWSRRRSSPWGLVASMGQRKGSFGPPPGRPAASGDRWSGAFGDGLVGLLSLPRSSGCGALSGGSRAFPAPGCPVFRGALFPAHPGRGLRFSRNKLSMLSGAVVNREKKRSLHTPQTPAHSLSQSPA